MCPNRKGDKSISKAFSASAIVFFLSFVPSHAGARDEALNFSAIGKDLTVSYLYKERRIAENIAKHYCNERFNSKAQLEAAACTKMWPIEINRCAITGICE